MAKGFVYLCAVIDWHSRKVLAHRVSISMEVTFCISLNEAIENDDLKYLIQTKAVSLPVMHLLMY
jgi:transposase InsO family protein